MIDINPYSGQNISGINQLIMRIDRIVRTVKKTRSKLRNYGTNIRDSLGKNNTRLVITLAQNELLTAMNDPINGVTDFKIEQVKILPDGKTFFIGVYNGERRNFDISATNL